MSEEYCKLRPAGRHILTIGSDLIQDPYAAVVELVKNAYDADAHEVRINFIKTEVEINDDLNAKRTINKIKIIISDNGHGMTKDVVLHKWMVPSTDDKLKRRESPEHRIMQGRKGIGRYAVSILGDDLTLETIGETKSGKEKTDFSVHWNDFKKAEFLDEVNIIVNSEKISTGRGTILTIEGDESFLSEWTKSQFDNLIFELKKLKTPIDEKNEKQDKFDIFLSVHNFTTYSDYEIKIEPYPLFSLYDYKISGVIDERGKGKLEYTMQKVRNSIAETINYSFGRTVKCGKVEFDIRVFDREKDSIDELIHRGLKDESGNYVGKLEARELLNKYNGIGVYRNGFRIRPLGDPDFDWLELNKKRVQKPSHKIGSDQVIGIVKIESEEESNLIEKSARDGLKDNDAYSDLIALTQDIIIQLEARRFEYRKKAGISRPALKIESEFEKLFSFDSLKNNVRQSLKKGKVDQNTSADILNAIDDSEKEKSKIIESVKNVVAVYQGQATLGKIINVVLHEGRKPLSFFKNQIPILASYYEDYQNGNQENFDAIFETLKNMSSNSDMLITLFNKIDPLATGKRTRKKDINLNTEVSNIFSVFSSQLKDIKTSIMSDNNEDVVFRCWKQDIYSIFTNLIENSIYWITEKNCSKREINITIHSDADNIEYIDYRDTGPGIEPSLIESGVIFEPEFSTKPEGTGLGLSIAGEAARRCGFELKALGSDSGAYFRLQSIGDDE